jgi:transcription elongation factor GreB
MSRGFVREDDQEEAPFIPPRAPLPPGVVNHVTPRGLRLLQEERTALEQERALPYENDQVRRRAWAEIDGKLELLNERIGNARVVEPPDPAPDEVRFGSSVTFRFLSGPQKGQEHTFALVGVDEASVRDGRIAFTSPIARALMGKRAGQRAAIVLGTAPQELEVLAVAY